MRLVLVAALLAWAPPASAKDVALVLNDVEQQAMVRALDTAVKSQGLSIAADMLHLLRRLQTAPEVTDTKVTPDEKPKE